MIGHITSASTTAHYVCWTRNKLLAGVAGVMRKGNLMSSTVKPKSTEELKSMHTGSLMSRHKTLLQCEESFDRSDQIIRDGTGLIEFKDTPEWQRAYSDIKQVLSQRENVPNKLEHKAARQAAAKSRR